MRQRIQLTGTNRSIGLNALISQCSFEGLSWPDLFRLYTSSDERKTSACGARSAGQARGLRVRSANACFTVPFFADLVVIAGSLYPIPSRTRPSKSPAPMVLSPKAWKSRSLPGLPRTERFTSPHHDIQKSKAPRETAGLFVFAVLSSSAKADDPVFAQLFIDYWMPASAGMTAGRPRGAHPAIGRSVPLVNMR